MTHDREALRTTFEQVPELYDRARPAYPDQVFDDIGALGGLSPAARVVEIGCGTGRATVPLAERGYRITCVELGPRLAAVARRNLASFPGVEVVEADFETWQPDRAELDAIVAFTAFHWIAPEVRYRKTAALLRTGGKLAVVSTNHVQPDDGDPFFVDVQEDYEAVVPDDPSTKATVGGPPPPEAIVSLSAEIAASGHFRVVAVRRYLWEVSYTTDEYIDLLNTYSGHRAYDDETRERILSRIRRRIDARPGGTARKSYLATLDLAERL